MRELAYFPGAQRGPLERRRERGRRDRKMFYFDFFRQTLKRLEWTQIIKARVRGGENHKTRSQTQPVAFLCCSHRWISSCAFHHVIVCYLSSVVKASRRTNETGKVKSESNTYAGNGKAMLVNDKIIK